MKRINFLLLLLLLFVSCKPFNGSMTVHKQLTFVIKPDENFDSGYDDPFDFDWDDDVVEEKEVTVPRGRYEAELDFESKTKAKLTLKSGKSKFKIDLKVPKGKTLPKYYGDINLSSHELEQPWGIEGSVDSEESRSSTHHGYESCSFTIKKRVCEYERRPRPRGRDFDREDRRHRPRPPREVCKVKYITVYGEQEVEYYYKYTDSHMELELIDEGSDRVLASFSGDRHESDKVYVYKGRCRRR